MRPPNARESNQKKALGPGFTTAGGFSVRNCKERNPLARAGRSAVGPWRGSSREGQLPTTSRAPLPTPNYQAQEGAELQPPSNNARSKSAVTSQPGARFRDLLPAVCTGQFALAGRTHECDSNAAKTDNVLCAPVNGVQTAVGELCAVK